MHRNGAISLAVDDGSDDGRARAGTGAFGFADATFPNSFLDIPSIEDANKDDVSPLGKLRMILDQRPQPPPIDRVEIVHKDTAVRVSHLQRGNFDLRASDVERI